jgi:hypothetical protein
MHLGVCQAGSVVDGHMGFLVARTRGAAKAPNASDMVTNTMEPGKLFDVDVDHVARPSPLVSPHRHRWLQVLQAPQAKGFDVAADGGERQGQLARVGPEGASIVLHGHSALQILWIERPPLGAAKTASIHQGGGTTAAVEAKPLVGRAKAKTSLRWAHKWVLSDENRVEGSLL